MTDRARPQGSSALVALDDRVRALDVRVVALETQPIRRWLLTVVLPGILLPVLIMTIKHFLYDRPAQSSVFQGNFEYGPDENKTFRYLLEIENTGWRTAIHVIGSATVQFNEPITWIRRISTSPAIEYGDSASPNSNACHDTRICTIGWGGLQPGGVVSVAFYTDGHAHNFPRATYGGKRINQWKCSLPNTPLSAFCGRKNNPSGASVAPGRPRRPLARGADAKRSGADPEVRIEEIVTP